MLKIRKVVWQIISENKLNRIMIAYYYKLIKTFIKVHNKYYICNAIILNFIANRPFT